MNHDRNEDRYRSEGRPSQDEPRWSQGSRPGSMDAGYGGQDESWRGARRDDEWSAGAQRSDAMNQGGSPNSASMDRGGASQNRGAWRSNDASYQDSASYAQGRGAYEDRVPQGRADWNSDDRGYPQGGRLNQGYNSASRGFDERAGQSFRGYGSVYEQGGSSQGYSPSYGSQSHGQGNLSAQNYGAQSNDRFHDGAQGFGARGYGQGGNRQYDRVNIDRPSYGGSMSGPSYNPTGAQGYGQGGSQAYNPNQSAWQGHNQGAWQGHNQGIGHLGGSQNFGAQDYAAQGGNKRAGMYGRGPMNYTRSDQRIYEDVCDALADDSNIDASQVEVKVEKGEVTLTGTVDQRDTRRRIEDVVERVSGVKDVSNQIKIQRAGSASASGSSSAGSNDSTSLSSSATGGSLAGSASAGSAGTASSTSSAKENGKDGPRH